MPEAAASDPPFCLPSPPRLSVSAVRNGQRVPRRFSATEFGFVRGGLAAWGYLARRSLTLSGSTHSRARCAAADANKSGSWAGLGWAARLESSAAARRSRGRGDSLLYLVRPFRWCREFSSVGCHFWPPARCRVACQCHTQCTTGRHVKRQPHLPLAAEARQQHGATRLSSLKQLEKHCRNLEYLASS